MNAMPPTRRRLLGVLAFAALMLAPAVAFASGGEEPTWPWYLQFAGSIVNFALLVFLIVRFAGPKLSGFLKQRQETIERQMRESAELRDKAMQQVGKLGGFSVTIPRQAGDGDKLYGAVTNRDIQAALAAEGHEVDRRAVVLEQPIKELGIYQVEVRLHSDVRTHVKVWVTAI